MTAKFLKGDFLQLNEKARKEWLPAWTGHPWYPALLQNSFQVINIILQMSAAENLYVFTLPQGCSTQLGKTFFVQEQYLEAVAPAEPECRCSIRTLMLNGCKC